ncbi:translation initiation factor IF-2-like [Choloepus didactylus]|uniref:translation initiation factor IF-2-like n=1 Tax=Choloepus didactylus TaxID=27675 RepID=UPI0018A01348|nr:translation initiation factor IF-2-like [Choloepus didactylus]
MGAAPRPPVPRPRAAARPRGSRRHLEEPELQVPGARVRVAALRSGLRPGPGTPSPAEPGSAWRRRLSPPAPGSPRIFPSTLHASVHSFVHSFAHSFPPSRSGPAAEGTAASEARPPGCLLGETRPASAFLTWVRAGPGRTGTGARARLPEDEAEKAPGGVGDAERRPPRRGGKGAGRARGISGQGATSALSRLGAAGCGEQAQKFRGSRGPSARWAQVGLEAPSLRRIRHLPPLSIRGAARDRRAGRDTGAAGSGACAAPDLRLSPCPRKAMGEARHSRAR